MLKKTSRIGREVVLVSISGWESFQIAGKSVQIDEQSHQQDEHPPQKVYVLLKNDKYSFTLYHE